MKGSSVESYLDEYRTFSGCDMTIVINVPLMVDGNRITKHYVVGEIQTLTYSTSMDRQPIRSISNVNAKDYVMGQRRIAGSMVFSVFDKHFSSRIINDLNELYGTGANILVDELPPFDINIVMANEYGHNSNIVIYGVRFINEGQVMSVNDIYMENTYQYVATGIKYADNTKHPNKLVKQHKIIGSNDNTYYNNINKLQESNEKDDYIILNSKDISNINIERPGNYDDARHKYQFVVLGHKKHNWVGDKREVSLYISPSRNTGVIIINNMKGEEVAKISYKNERILYALKEGEYYARYTDKDSSSNVEYIIIREDSKNNSSDKPGSTTPEDNKDSKPIIDTPIIDEIEDDYIKVVDDVKVKDRYNNVYYPDRKGYIYNLVPGEIYYIEYDDKEYEIKTENSSHLIYEKLKESLKHKFYETELELSNVLYDLENFIYRENQDIIMSSYNLYLKYLDYDNQIYKDIINNILLYSSNLYQNRKIFINKNNIEIPFINNYSTNRIEINSSAIKLVIKKYPYNKNQPKEIYKDQFIYKEGKYYYDIKDYNDNMYKIYTINHDGIKSPSIYMFSGIESESIYTINNNRNTSVDKRIYIANSIKPDMNLYLMPTVSKIDNNSVYIESEDLINDAVLVCTSYSHIDNKDMYIKKNITPGSIVNIDSHDMLLKDDEIYLTWLEDNKSNIISKAFPFTTNDNENEKTILVLKNKLYQTVLRSEEYSKVSDLSQKIILKHIEEGPLSYKTLKEMYILDILKNNHNIISNGKDILLIDKIKFQTLSGIKKNKVMKEIKVSGNRIFLKDNHVANIDVICPLTGQIDYIKRSNIINLSLFRNKYLILNIKDKNDSYVLNPISILVYNDIEVIE